MKEQSDDVVFTDYERGTDMWIVLLIGIILFGASFGLNPFESIILVFFIALTAIAGSGWL